MKIVQINNLYDDGSTGRITADIHNGLLKAGFDSVVFYGRGRISSVPKVYKICSEFYSKINNLWSRVTGIMYGGCYFSTRKLEKLIERESPDIVHIQCINGYFVNIYNLLNYLKKRNLKVVVTLHAEFMYTANCGHSYECQKWLTGCGHCSSYKTITKSFYFDSTNKSWYKMHNAFKGFGDNIIICSVSPWLKGRACISPFLSNFRHEVVLNGIDTSVFHYIESNTLKNDIGLSTWGKVILHVTPEFSPDKYHLKGGCYVMEIAKKLPQILFLVVGPTFEKFEVPANVRILGKITDKKKLASLYSLADFTLLTSKRETFSLVCAESLCCGTRVVGFKAGAPEQIALQEYSRWFEYGDIDKVANYLMSAIEHDVDKCVISKIAIEKYAKEQMINNYIDIYKRMLNESTCYK